MAADPKGCPHQLNRPPDLVTDAEGVSYLLFECMLCGGGIGLKLNADGEVESEFVVPGARKCA